MPKQKPTDPELLREVPASTTYNLTMYDSDGGAAKDIELSREEFIALKAHLGRLRHIHEAPNNAEIETATASTQAGEDVPEPGSFILLGSTLAVLMLLRQGQREAA